MITHKVKPGILAVFINGNQCSSGSVKRDTLKKAARAIKKGDPSAVVVIRRVV